MKDSLEKFVNKNREAFDDKEPSGNVWDGIQRSFQNGKKQRMLWNSLVLWRAAAVLFLGLSVYFFTTRESIIRMPKKETAILQREFLDLEKYYGGEIAEKIGLINDFEGVGEDTEFTQDFQKLDAMYQVLKDEMKSHPGNKVKDAMILNLLVRIDLLNQQLKRLEDHHKKKPASEV